MKANNKGFTMTEFVLTLIALGIILPMTFEVIGTVDDFFKKVKPNAIEMNDVKEVEKKKDVNKEDGKFLSETSFEYLIQDVETSKKMNLVDYLIENESIIKTCLMNKEIVSIKAMNKLIDDENNCYLPKNINKEVNKKNLYAVKSVNQIEVYNNNKFIMRFSL